MPARYLYLLRHAKSDWDNQLPDFDRPLASRGKRDCKVIGKWLKKQRPKAQRILVSPAARTRQTIERVCERAGLDMSTIDYEDSLYLADLHTLLSMLAGIDDKTKCAMLVGHNPGMEELLAKQETSLFTKFGTS